VDAASIFTCREQTGLISQGLLDIQKITLSAALAFLAEVRGSQRLCRLEVPIISTRAETYSSSLDVAQGLENEIIF
jgi:hypothetical protein